MTHELPQGWAWSTIAECFFEMRNGTTASQNTRGRGLPVSRIETIQNRRFDLGRTQYVDGLSATLVDNFRYRIGDIALSHINSYEHVGKTALYDGTPKTFIHGMNLLRLRLGHDLIEPHFAYLFMQTDLFREEVRRRVGHAVNQVSINQTNLGEVPLVVAPLDEQKRVAAKLEALLAKVEQCQKRLARVPVILKRFRQSVLSSALSGRLTVDWRENNSDIQPAPKRLDKLKQASGGVHVRRGVPEDVPLSDVVAAWELPATWGVYSAAELLRIGAFVDLKDGNHGSNHPKVSEFSDSGLPFITAAQVNNYRIDYDGAYKLAGEPLKRINVGFAKPGDVIYTHKGSVGRVAVADRDCVLTPQTTYYRTSPRIFVNRFLMYYLASEPFSQQVDIVKEQTTRDFVPISEQYLLFHRIPPIAEQREIVRRVDQWFALADQIEFRYKEAQERVDRLSQSVLAKAFRGELVATEAELAGTEGRSFESAEDLLDRISSAKRDWTEAKQGSRSRRAKKAVA